MQPRWAAIIGTMIRLSTFTPRMWLIVAHDLLATAAAVVASFFIRFEEAGLAERWRLAGRSCCRCFVVYAGIVYCVFRPLRGEVALRLAAGPLNIVRAATVLAVSLLVLDYILVAPNVYGAFFFGKITIVLYWLLQMFFLGGSAHRLSLFPLYAHAAAGARRGDATPTLVLGRAADAEVLLRAIESGAVKKIWPVGILSPSPADQGQAIRGIPVLGASGRSRSASSPIWPAAAPVSPRIVLTPSRVRAGGASRKRS